MEVQAEVVVELKDLQDYEKSLSSRQLAVYKKWVIRYRTFIQRRFNKFSRGGGDWQPLKIRKGSILRDTNTLFGTLAPTLSAPPGSINKFEPDGVVIGYSGNAAHPAGPTIPQIALWHQTGAGNLPVREIIVLPDSATLEAMKADAKKAYDAD